jgi:hypothetical protein
MTLLRDLMLADLEHGLAIARDGHEVGPAWRILAPGGDFLILTQFDPDKPYSWQAMMDNMPFQRRATMEQPIRIILRWLVIPLFLLAFFYIIASVATFITSIDTASQSGNLGSQLSEISRLIREDLGNATSAIWDFVKPLLQLGIILLIIYSFIVALGIDLGLRAPRQDISIQTLLAFFVVGGFVLAALLSSQPASWLKDLALVVVGFYFGTRTRDPDRDKPEDDRGPLGSSGPTAPAGSRGGEPPTPAHSGELAEDNTYEKANPFAAGEPPARNSAGGRGAARCRLDEGVPAPSIGRDRRDQVGSKVSIRACYLAALKRAVSRAPFLMSRSVNQCPQMPS